MNHYHADPLECSECGMAPWDRHCCSCEPCVQKRIERAVRTGSNPAETCGEWRAPAEYVLQTPRGLLAYLDDCAGTTAKELIVEITAALRAERERLLTKPDGAIDYHAMVSRAEAERDAERERAEKMRPVYEAACRYMSNPSPATKEALLRAWREDVALRGEGDR